MGIIKYVRYLTRPATLFVVVNIAVSFIGFLRSFAMMRWLGLEELGVISLVQTVIQFIGLFQFGLINGGYRMFSLNKAQDRVRVNNLLFTIFIILFFVFLFIWIILFTTGNSLIVDNDLLLVAIFAGSLTLVSNWLNNTLIGKQRLVEINRINIISISVSVLSLSLIYFIGLWGAVISITFQPLCYVILTLIRNKDLRPTHLLIDKELIKEILGYGFIPFLSGIFSILNLQVERWSIAFFLGNEALGRFYLVFLFNTLFMLIPTSVQSIFFPKAVLSYDEGNLLEFKSVIKRLSLVTIVYDVIILLFTVILFKFIVTIIFPLHADNVIYVYLFIPGLIVWSFDSVISLVLNASLRLKVLLYAGLAGFLINIIGIFLLKNINLLSLESMACLKSLVLIVPTVITLLYVYKNKVNIEKGYAK